MNLKTKWSPNFFFLFFFISFNLNKYLFFSSYSYWWSIGKIPPKLLTNQKEVKKLCHVIPGISREQRKWCIERPEVMIHISKSCKMAAKNCGKIFWKHRWNCSSFHSRSVFGKIAFIATKESAFLYALMTAGLVQTLSRACGSGIISNCSFSKKKRLSSFGNDNIKAGEDFSRKFIDSLEKKNHDLKSKINLHNIEVGRRTLRENIIEECKCHGFSGSCNVKTCWKKIKKLKTITKILKIKYDNAKMVSVSKKNNKIIMKNSRVKKATKNDLIFFESSPDYCSPDIKLGIKGTSGRICSLNPRSLNSCDILCCGRGYDTMVTKKRSKCHCKFKWCCSVVCQQCIKIREQHVCKS